jgi:hypothetical protein
MIVDMVYDDLFEFAGEGIPLLIVPGNHERSYQVFHVNEITSGKNFQCFYGKQVGKVWMGLENYFVCTKRLKERRLDQPDLRSIRVRM